MPATRPGERGQVAAYAVLLFPLLMLVLSLVLAVGTLEGTRARLRAQIDMAALTATQALDVSALAAGGRPRLVPDEAAQLVSVTNASGIDPITGATTTAPTVSIEIRAPVRVPLLGLAGLSPVVTLDITGSAAARS